MLRTIAKPTNIFLVDGIGALITTLLTLTLAQFEVALGIPSYILWILATIACVYTLYSFSCYYHKPKHWKLYLVGIMFANGIYSFLTAVLVFYFWEQIARWSLVYFISEICVICFLISIEYTVAQHNEKA